MRKGVRIWDLEGSNWKTNVWNSHLFLQNNPNPMQNRPHKQYYRVPFNKELLAGTVPVNSLFLTGIWLPLFYLWNFFFTNFVLVIFMCKNVGAFFHICFDLKNQKPIYCALNKLYVKFFTLRLKKKWVSFIKRHHFVAESTRLFQQHSASVSQSIRVSPQIVCKKCCG